MTPHARRAAALILSVSAAVMAVGMPLSGPDGRVGVALGAAAAAAVQLVMMVVVVPRWFADHPFAGVGTGMLARFGLLALAGMVAVPRLGLPPVPTLLSLATTLFLTGIGEPLLAARNPVNEAR